MRYARTQVTHARTQSPFNQRPSQCMMAWSPVGCGVFAELTAEDAAKVVNQGSKRSIQEITPRQNDKVQTVRRFVVSEEFADQALRPIAPHGTTESTGRDDAQSTLFPRVR